MQTHRVVLALNGLNLALLLFTLTRIAPALADEGVAPVLRGRSFEIVDQQGRVRASLNVLPAGTSAKGDRYPETVLLRLITERGRPSVKISASEEAAGISLAGPSNTKNTYVIVEAKGVTSSLMLKNEDGREQSLHPEHAVELVPRGSPEP